MYVGDQGEAYRPWTNIRRAENEYARRLRRVVQQIYDLLYDTLPREPGYPADLSDVESMLGRYAALLEPWARAVAQRFLAEVGRREERAWTIRGQNMSRQLRQEIRETSVGQVLREFLETQVQLITSLPLDAAQRVHEASIQGVTGGRRAAELARTIQVPLTALPERYRQPEIDPADIRRALSNRATLIARTETARVASTLTMVRAKQIGGIRYFWRTVRDGRVRDTHAAMGRRSDEGETFLWDEAPLVEPQTGKHYAPGMTFNCRCFAEPIIPDKYNV